MKTYCFKQQKEIFSNIVKKKEKKETPNQTLILVIILGTIDAILQMQSIDTTDLDVIKMTDLNIYFTTF